MDAAARMNAIIQAALVAVIDANDTLGGLIDSKLPGWGFWKVYINHGSIYTTLVRPRDDLHSLTPEELTKIKTLLGASWIGVTVLEGRVAVSVGWKID